MLVPADFRYMASKARSVTSRITLTQKSVAPKIRYRSASSAIALAQTIICGRSKYKKAKDTIVLSQTCSVKVDWQTAFDDVIRLMGMNENTQGMEAMAYGLLQFAASTQARSDGYGSPCAEVLARLQEAGVNENALAHLRQMMNSAMDAYSRGQIR